MPSVAKTSILSALVGLSESTETCSKSDMQYVSGSESYISSILDCSVKAGASSGTISTCMSSVYPLFASVTQSCLACTVSVLETDTGVSCLPKCIKDTNTSDCMGCSPSLISQFTHDCVIAPSANPNSGDTGIPATAPESTCNSADLTLIMNDGGMASLMSTSIIQCASDTECIISTLSDLSSDCQQCAVGVLTNSTNCINSCNKTDSCDSCSNIVATEFSSQCSAPNLSTSKSSNYGIKGIPIQLIALAILFVF